MNEQTFDKENVTGEQSGNMSAEQSDMAQDNRAENTAATEPNADDDMSRTQTGQNPEGQQATEKLKEELAEAKDKYIRLVAEFDNFRRRTAKERIELVQTAGKDIIQSLLVVMDDIDRATKQMENSDDPALIKEGVALVFNKLKSTLQQKGLKKMDSIHEEFDADLHDAITEIPAPTPELVGKVVDETEPGYYLNDKLIRHAKVIVGK